MKLDWQTICDVKAEILDLLDKTSDIAELDEYWHVMDRPDYPIKELRRLDINIYDGDIYGNEPGYRAMVHIVDDVDDDSSIDYKIYYRDVVRVGFPDLPDHLKEVK